MGRYIARAAWLAEAPRQTKSCVTLGVNDADRANELARGYRWQAIDLAKA
jgi:hypothetical protein